MVFESLKLFFAVQFCLPSSFPTERISAFVDLLLKPLVNDLPSYIRDTKDFLTALQAVPPLPDHALLFTMDVVELYNNIPHVDGLEACRAFLNGRRVQDPPTEDIVKTG